jgi:hypothetical protein
VDPAIFWLFLVALGSGGVGVVALAAYIDKTNTQRREAVWAEAARRLDGGFFPGSLFSPARSMGIVATIEGVEVCIDCPTVPRGRARATYTRTSAPAEAPAVFTMRIYEESLLSTLGKKLGMQDVVVGDARFDELFVVKASDEAMARAWLVPTVTEMISRLSWSHDLQDCRLTSMRPGIVEDANELVHAALTTARLAARGAALRAEWERLARQLGGVLRGGLWGAGARALGSGAAIEIGGPALPVCVEIARSRPPGPSATPSTGTCVRAARGGGEPFVAARGADLSERDGQVVPTPNEHTLELRSSDPAATAARFDEERRHALDALGPSAVVATETEVTVLFAGVVLDVERLHGAIAMARDLASAASTGPYR